MKLARLAPLVVVALVGCSPSPTTAAEVGDVTISTQAVSDVVAECPMVGQDEVTEQLALNMMVAMDVFREVGDNVGLELNEEEMQGLVKQHEGFGPLVAQQPACMELIVPSVAFSFLQTEVEPQKLTEAIEQVDVEVNPRYGEWSSEGLAIGGSGSLSTPVAEG